MPKISIIIPVYNVEDYLAQCLDSIEKQTIAKDLELVCVNDGSPDGSLYILRQYEKKYPNVRIINQLNSGVGIARNNGIKAATGEFVCFMDSDDYYLENDSLENLYNAAKEHNVLIAGGSFSEDHGTWIRKKWDGIYEKYTFTKDGLMKYSDYQFDYGYHRFIYNREMLIKNDILFPPYIRFQDPPFYVKAMIFAGEFYALKQVTYCYRYGHQKLKWDERRTSHVIMGITDNIRYAREAGLNELHALSAWRLIVEYRKPIEENIKSKIILNLLMDAQKELDFDVLKDDEKLKDGVMPIIYDNIQS